MKDSGMSVKTGSMSARTRAAIDLVEAHSARNYAPLPVVIAEGDGAWVRDVDGRRYLDMLAAYGALNFGHRHPQLTAVARAQLDRLTLTSRAFHNDQLGTFCAALAELAGMDLVLPMNTGAEGVETALKTARKWGYQVKGIPADQAKIVVVGGNFHGRTITIVSFSDDKESTADFGPFTPGFVSVPYGDADALRAAIDDWTAAVLIEPIQGEGGVIIPPDGYLRAVRDVCTEANVLMIADEIQSGLGAPAIPLPATTRVFAPTSTFWARHSAVASCRCPRSCPDATCSECFGPASMAAPSAETRSRARSGSRSSA